MSSSLQSYIDEARKKSATDDQIRDNLIRGGWTEQDVNSALSPKLSDIPLPTPPVPHIGMWTGFLYIIFFISLYILSTATGNIFHFWVEKVMPQPASITGGFSLWSWYSDESIRASIAAIIVSFPIFAILGIMLKKQLVKRPTVRSLRSRKQLIYITLLGTFLIMLSQVISTLYSFLSGSGTWNAIGHLMVTLSIAGTIFLYFISEVKNDSKT